MEKYYKNFERKRFSKRRSLMPIKVHFRIIEVCQPSWSIAWQKFLTFWRLITNTLHEILRIWSQMVFNSNIHSKSVLFESYSRTQIKIKNIFYGNVRLFLKKLYKYFTKKTSVFINKLKTDDLQNIYDGT